MGTMNADTTNRNRQAGGQPTGGQFATEARGTDTGVTLASPPEPQTRAEQVDRFGEDMLARHPGTTFDLREVPGGWVRLSLISVPADQRGQGTATAMMNELVETADAEGWPLSLTASDDFGASKTRLTKFYRQFGFVPNKGRAKDYTTTDGMIRQPR